MYKRKNDETEPFIGINLFDIESKLCLNYVFASKSRLFLFYRVKIKLKNAWIVVSPKCVDVVQCH